MDETSTGQLFYGPDAEILLDDGFSDGYCFRVVGPDRNRPNQIGLGFSAADRKAGRVDINGALWIDTVARALREIEFRYVGLGRAQLANPNGTISFREMANGVVLIDRWFIRLPKLAVDTSYDRKGARVLTERYDAEESGGEIARASWPDGTAWRNSLGTLHLHIRFPRQGVPAVGRLALLDGTDYYAISDDNGEFEIRDLLPGPYALIVVDAALSEIDLHPPPAFKFIAARDSTIAQTVNLRTTAEFIHDRCIADGRTDSAGVFLLGRVMTSGGLPVQGVEVVFTRPAEQQRLFSYTTGSEGIFQLCLNAARRHESFAIRIHSKTGLDVYVLRTLNDSVTIVRIPFDPPPDVSSDRRRFAPVPSFLQARRPR